MFKFRSVNNIVIAPANTGKESRSSNAVIATDHTSRGIRSNVIPVDRMLITVVMKFTAPRMEDTPAK